MTATDMNEEVYACPVFEGSEKRISVTFAPGPATPERGLRDLSRANLDAMLDLAACQIVSFRSNSHFDAYVLSESSLFVYPDRMVLKTCGTTKLLSCVPFMEQLAAEIGMTPSRVKYTRASYLFPEQQPAPHSSFEAECRLLHDLFGRLGRTSAYVLGDSLNGLQWHVFVAGTNQSGLSPLTSDKPIHTLEVCMTGLSTRKAQQFFRGDDFVSAQHVTLGSGIQALVPGAVIDDYVFEPCGYSMNGQQAGVFSTIHITPEDGFSYASFELCGYDPDTIDTAELVAKVLEVFHPRQISVALSMDSSASAAATMGWSGGFLVPPKYVAHSSSYQEFKAGGYVAYFSLEADRAAAGKSGSDSDASSPRAVLKHCPSFHAITPCGSSGASSTEGEDYAALLGGRHSLLGASMDSDAPGEMTVDDVLALCQAVPILRGDPPTLDTHIRQLVSRHGVEDTLLLVDLGAVRRQYTAWTEALPGVRPFYQVRVNPNRALLSLLGALGAGFSCASEAEVHLVLSLGIPPHRIVMASPSKRPRDVRFAADKGVRLATFEGVGELCKLARWHPGAQALIRMDATLAPAPAELAEMMQTAQALGVEVAGVSVVVGGAGRAPAPAELERAVEVARAAVDCGRQEGLAMKVVDINCSALEPADLALLAASLDRHFSPGTNVCIAVETGSYFAAPAATLASVIYARRRALDPESASDFDYWVAVDAAAAAAEGVGAAAAAAALKSPLPFQAAPSAEARALQLAPSPSLGGPAGKVQSAEHAKHTCAVHGPAAGGLLCALPECQEWDWVVFPGCGAGAPWERLCGGVGELVGPDTPTFYVYSREA